MAPSLDLIDLFSEPQLQRQTGLEIEAESCNDQTVPGRNSLSNIALRMSDSHSNITNRNDSYENSFKNVTMRSSRGSDAFPNISINKDSFGCNVRDTNQRNSRVNNEQDTGVNQHSSKVEVAASTLDPDIVKSTIVSIQKGDCEQIKQDSVLIDQTPTKDINSLTVRKSWAEKLSEYKDAIDGQTQTTPNRDCVNKNNSGEGSIQSLSPQTDQHLGSEWRNQLIQLQDDLMKALKEKEDAYSKIILLQEKLEATENTVRQLSRKMKSYQQSGSDQSLKRRSSSEASLNDINNQIQTDNLMRKGSDDHLTFSMDRASMEKERDVKINRQSLKNFSTMSPSLIGMSLTNSSHVRSSPTSTLRLEGTCLFSPDKLSYVNGSPSLHNNAKLDDYSNNSAISTIALGSGKNCLSSQNVSPGSNNSNGNQNAAESPEEYSLDGIEHGQNSSLNNNTSHHRQRNSEVFDSSSMFNNTGVDWRGKDGEQEQEDPTLTSLLVTDYTFLHKRLSILSESFLPTSTTEQSFNNATLNVDKLQARLAHLERIILMQKEEITVYESLLASMGVPVLLTADKESEATGDTKESLLRQHLVEIRKLRQRLENLDLESDPDLLLIFNTHTQQRISHQELTISKLQQRLLEKEETWNREIMETEHRMNREMSQLAQKLELTKKEVENQHISLEEQESIIKRLKESLELKDQEMILTKDKCEKMKREQAEIEGDLIKREKEFLEMENVMFKLELAKEEFETQKAMLQAELEENEKQVTKQKCDVDHYKESCRSLKEVLRDKEDALQEQVQCLKKIAQEKTTVDEKLSQLKVELDEMKIDADRMKSELDEKKKWESSYVSLKEEFTQHRIIFEQKMSSHKQALNDKATLEVEICRMKEERLNTKVESDDRMDNLRKDIEKEQKNNHILGEEISKLRTLLDKRCDLESELRIRLKDLEAALKKEETERVRMENEVKEKSEKVKKRDRQCQFLCNKFGKLDAAYTEQNKLLKDKTEAMNSMKKQMQLYETTLTSLSKDNHQDIMKELFHELMLTKKQVGDLLTRLEESSNQLKSLPEFNLDGFSSDPTTISTKVTTAESTTYQTTILANDSATNFTTSEELTSHFKTTTGADFGNFSGMSNSSFTNFDMHSLFAVLKLVDHEKACKEVSECLISLSGIQARIDDRLKVYKSQSITESLDYSTLREVGMTCCQLRNYLNEISRIVSLAKITELPPVNEEGQFHDPETEKLRMELSQLQSKYNHLDQVVKEQQGKLKQREKDWEHTVCRQLIKTSQDLEQAKENLNLSRGILQQVNTTAKNKTADTSMGGDSCKSKVRLSLQQTKMN